MKREFYLYFLSFLWIWVSQNFAKADFDLKHTLGSDEFLHCDYARFESQLESLKTGNEFLKLRIEIMQLQLDKQGELLQGFVKQSEKIPVSLQSLESKIMTQNREHFGEIKDLLSKQNQMAHTRYREPPIDDKWQMMSDVKKIVKDHDVLFETFSEKLENIENILQEASWETQSQQLANSISKNLTILKNIDNKLTNLEAVVATKTDQLVFNRNLQKYFNKNEATKICLKGADQELVCTSQSYPTNCADFNPNYCANNKCRIYNHHYGSEPFLVACDDKTDGGGWTIIQRRINGSVDFYRGWSEYKDGFGNIDGELFIGLDKLHVLTNTLQPMELLIQLKDFNDTMKYAKYNAFVVGNETEHYKLHKVGTYSGNAGDSLSDHQGYNFTTKDRDNDLKSDSNCAIDRGGAWWYWTCYQCNLNGKYFNMTDENKPVNRDGIVWSAFNGYDYSMKFVQMMIRPKKI